MCVWYHLSISLRLHLLSVSLPVGMSIRPFYKYLYFSMSVNSWSQDCGVISEDRMFQAEGGAIFFIYLFKVKCL